MGMEHEQLKNLPADLSQTAKDWLHAILMAQEEGRYRDFDDLLLFAARLMR